MIFFLRACRLPGPVDDKLLLFRHLGKLQLFNTRIHNSNSLFYRKRLTGEDLWSWILAPCCRYDFNNESINLSRRSKCIYGSCNSLNYCWIGSTEHFPCGTCGNVWPTWNSWSIMGKTERWTQQCQLRNEGVSDCSIPACHATSSGSPAFLLVNAVQWCSA